MNPGPSELASTSFRGPVQQERLWDDFKAGPDTFSRSQVEGDWGGALNLDLGLRVQSLARKGSEGRITTPLLWMSFTRSWTREQFLGPMILLPAFASQPMQLTALLRGVVKLPVCARLLLYLI